MSNSGGKITAPVSIEDVCQVLGVTTRDVGYLCSNAHGKINRYSWVKPVNEAGIGEISQTSILNYVKHVKLKTYTVGDTVPTTALANYDTPTGGTASPYRFTDFKGYSHNEYPHTIDLSSLSGKTLSPTSTVGTFNITYKHDSGKSLFQYLVNGENIVSTGSSASLKNWYFGILIIAKYGSDTRYYIISKTSFDATKITFNALSLYPSIFTDMASIDISKYTCTVFGVAFLYGSQVSADLGYEIGMKLGNSNQKVSLLPQFGSLNPLATNVKFSKIPDMVYLQIFVTDESDGNRTYFPEHYSITASSTGFTIEKSFLYPNTLEYGDFFFENKYKGTPIYGKYGWLIHSNYLYLNSVSSISLKILADKDNTGMFGFGNYTSSRDDGLSREFSWTNINLNSYKNQSLILWLGLAFTDPNYRDD